MVWLHRLLRTVAVHRRLHLGAEAWHPGPRFRPSSVLCSARASMKNGSTTSATGQTGGPGRRGSSPKAALHWQVGDDTVYLEVLASFRGDPTLEADVDLIESDDDEFPTIPPGRLDYGWSNERLVCTERLSGSFALPSHPETLPTLRESFCHCGRSGPNPSRVCTRHLSGGRRTRQVGQSRTRSRSPPVGRESVNTNSIERNHHESGRRPDPGQTRCHPGSPTAW